MRRRPGTNRPYWCSRRLGAYGLFLCLASAYTLVVCRHLLVVSSEDDGAKSRGVATGQFEWNGNDQISTISGEVAAPSGGRSAQAAPRPSPKDGAINKTKSPVVSINGHNRAVNGGDKAVAVAIGARPKAVHRRRRRNVHVPAKYNSVDVPIRMVHPSINETSILNWSLSKNVWNETTTFDQMLKSGNSSALPSIGAGQRAVVILHLSPKMGSLTLRLACKNLLQDKCQVENDKVKDPPGYDDVAELSKLIVRCKSINHFCLRRDMFDPRKPEQLFENIAFLHLYPFRQYDEWTLSAHKMPFDRGGEKLCAKMKALFDDCRDEHGELSFRKYPKVELSDFRSQIAFLRDRSGSSSHHIILHDFKDIDRLLSLLSVTYRGLGRMIGSSRMYHASNVKKKGTCDMKILKAYHECFTKDLTNLP